MKLSDVIKLWDRLHTHDCGELGFADLEQAIGAVVGVENDCASPHIDCMNAFVAVIVHHLECGFGGQDFGEDWIHTIVETALKESGARLIPVTAGPEQAEQLEE